MEYIISINSNYANKNYGKFITKDETEYLLFRYPERIYNMDIEIKFEGQPFNDLQSKWDVIPTDKVHIYLVNNKLVEFLNSVCENQFELVDAKICCGNELISSNYRLLHILNNDIAIGNIARNDDGLYVSKHFYLEYKKNKLKGWKLLNLDL